MELTTEKLQARLPGHHVRFYEQIESTNDVAMKILSEQRTFADLRAEADIVVANEQIKGKGRLGRSWYTPPNTALIVSVILPLRERRYISRVTMIGAVAIAEMIEALSHNYPDKRGELQMGIKWPNDVQVNSRKVSGVLAEASWAIENTDDPRLHGIVLGMGVNVRTDFTGTELGNTAISIEHALGIRVNRLELLIDLVERVDRWYQQISTPHLLDVWKSHLNMIGKVVTVDQGRIMGVAERVDDEGALWIRDHTGEMHRVVAGDIGLGEG